jgi:hypothetical protein
MKLAKPAVIVVALVFASLPVAFAENSKANETLLKATSPFEDTVKYALASRETNLVKSLAAANSQAAAIRDALPAAAQAQFDSLFRTMLNAAAGTNNYGVAKSAVQIFHLLIENLAPDGLKVPIEVSWLDYAGFNLHVLSAAPQRDWETMRKTVADAASWWEAIKTKVSDKSLRYTMNSTIKGLQQASKEENLPMLYFAAQIDLDVVDLLENHFEGKK